RGHWTALERRGRVPVDGYDGPALDRALPVDRPPEAVDDPTEEGLRGAHDETAARRLHFVVGAHTDERAERKADGLPTVEADHLARERLPPTLDRHHVAHAHAGHAEAEREARDAEDPARRPYGGRLGELCLEGFERS